MYINVPLESLYLFMKTALKSVAYYHFYKSALAINSFARKAQHSANKIQLDVKILNTRTKETRTISLIIRTYKTWRVDNYQ